MKRHFALLLFALTAGSSFSSLRSQTVSTEILGLVTDSSGSIVPGAAVTVRRVATGDVRTIKTNDNGYYTFPLLEIGEYEITCVAPGFKTEIRRGVTLQLQDKARIDFQLQVGQQAETVEVRGDAPLLSTQDATLGQVIGAKTVLELPLNGRNFAQLATLTPGVVAGVSRMGLDGQGGYPIPGQTVTIAANGQRDINQNITLDGVIATEPWTNTMQFTPSIEAIQEFKVQSAVYSAEYGMNSGAQVNVAIRSGTNDFHGTAFAFLRNDIMDARGYFLPPDQPKNKLRRNQFGAVVSGPVIRDRTFWLFNWESRRERRGTPALASVPTLAMRQGDFSELLIPGNRWYPRDASPAARAIRIPGSAAPIPNNILPPGAINPVARNLLTSTDRSPFTQGGFLPLPNIDQQARAAGSVLNLTGTRAQTIDSDQYLFRIDHRFGNYDRIFGRYVGVKAGFTEIPVEQVNQTTTSSRPHNLALGWTRILTASLLSDFRYGYSRATNSVKDLFTETGFQQRSLGLDFRVTSDGNRPLESFEEGLPVIGIAGFAGIPIPTIAGRLETHRAHEFSESLAWSRGQHNFKFGGLYRHNATDRRGGNLPRGRLDFTRDIEGVPDAFAAFLLGYPTSAQTAEGLPQLFGRQAKLGLYWLDDYKVTPRLTVNFGVRWDIFGVVQDARGRFRNLSFAEGEGQLVDGVRVPLLVPNPEVKQKLYDTNPWQIMPRLGIAWRLTDKMVIRTGAGQFYDAQMMNNFTILALSPPFSGSSLFQNNRTAPTATLDNPFAGASTQSPVGLTMLGNLQAEDGNRSLFLNNHIWQWTFDVQRTFGENLVASIAYVGSKASNLDVSISNFNNPDPAPGNIQTRRPYPFYADSREPARLLPLGAVRQLDTSQNATYHALQMRAEKRYSRGLTFLASYNLQKAIAVGYSANATAAFGSNAPQNPRNIRLDRGRSQIDQRHRFVFSNVWELPWLRQSTGWKGRLLGGWSLNGILQLSSGLPVTVNQNGDSQNTGAGSQPRPHLQPGAVVERVSPGSTVGQWFDTSAFVRSKCDGCAGEGLYLPGTLGYGNAGVSLFDAPGQAQWDGALFKDFPVREGHRLQFRWEVFNASNTPRLGAPDRTLGSATFGRITTTLSNNREMQLALKYIF